MRMQTINGEVSKSLLDFYSKANEKGYFNFLNRDEFLKSGKHGMLVCDGGLALQNYNVGLGTALTRINNEHIDMVTQALKAELIVGERSRELDFQDEELLTPEIKFAGEPSPYNDFDRGNSLELAINWIKTGHVRDTINIRVGDLESSKLSLANINETDKKVAAAIKILMQRWNDVCFNGYNSSNASVYGILNYPSLSPYIALKTDLANVTYATLSQDILTLISELQAQNNYIEDTTLMKLCVTQSFFNALKTEGNMQKPLIQVLKENYPNLVIIPNINEFKGAYEDKSVVYIVAETQDDGSLQKRTAKAPYSEIGLFSRVINETKYITQDISIGHSGVVFYKPYNVVRGVVAGGNG